MNRAAVSGDVELMKKHLKADCICLNHFAATEASVIAQHCIDFDGEYNNALIPAGQAAKGMTIKLLDEQGKPVATGEQGEIVLCSEFLSPG